MILAGSLLDFRMRFGKAIPDDAKIIQLDLDAILIGQNRRADIGLVGNLGATFEAMTDVIGARRGGKLDWSRLVHEWRKKEVRPKRSFAASSTRTRCRSIRCGFAKRSPTSSPTT